MRFVPVAGGLTGAMSKFFELAVGRLRATPRVCTP